MISVLAVLLASVALVNGQPAMPNMGAGFPGMPQAMGQPIGMGQPMGQQAQQTSTNAMNVGPSVFSNEQIAAVQQDYARRVGMDSNTAQQLDSQLMAQIAAQRAPAAGAAGAQQGFRAMQMNVNQALNGFGAARPGVQPVAQTFTNQQMVGNPLAQNPLGQNSLGQNSLGQNPLGQNPLGQNPLGQNPLGQYPGAATADNNMMMGVDRSFLQQLMNQPQMQQYQRSLTDMGYGNGAMNTQAANQPMMQTQQMAAPYQTQQMASPYSIQQMATPYSIQQMNNPGMGNFPMDNYMNNQYNLQPTQQSINDANTGFSNLLSGMGAGMTQGGQPINTAGRNIAAGNPPQMMASEAIPTQGNLFATIPGVGRIDLGIPRVVPSSRVQPSTIQMNAATAPESGRVSTPIPNQINQGQAQQA